MALNRLLTTPCSIVTRTYQGVNDLGEPTPVLTTRTTTCHLNPRGPEDDDGPEQRASVLGTVYLRPDETVTAHDRIVVGGTAYEVDGPPVVRRRAPTGQPHHLEVPVRVSS